jgi:hypothetical protein
MTFALSANPILRICCGVDAAMNFLPGWQVTGTVIGMLNERVDIWSASRNMASECRKFLQYGLKVSHVTF